jgi:hypothetical protein
VFENIPPEQAKIAIDIPDDKVEKKSHRPTVCFPDPYTMQGIGAPNLVASYKIDVGAEDLHKVVYFPYVVLSIAIRIKNELLPSIREATDQCSSITQVAGMVDYAKLRYLALSTL